MKRLLSLFVALSFGLSIAAQQVDTLQVFSKAFGKERTVYVHTPEFYKFRSEKVRLPVFYILDGQHEWFINPLLSTIRYLQYTHEIPQAILVVIPHEDRVQECAIKNLDKQPLPLHRFITSELHQHIEPYGTNGYNLLIGHSFSASFSLYSHLKSPDFYSAVFSHTPLDKLEELIQALQESAEVNPDQIYLSTGGIDRSKDYYHRRKYDELKEKYPEFFKNIHNYEANTSAHNAVPIVANPVFLSELFYDFCARFNDIAEVDENYQLIEKPASVKKELEKIDKAAVVNGTYFTLEIAELNGIASRYISSDYKEHCNAVCERGIELYPDYPDFHIYLGENLIPDNKKRGMAHLEKGWRLLQRYYPEDKEYIQEIEAYLESLKNE